MAQISGKGDSNERFIVESLSMNVPDESLWPATLGFASPGRANGCDAWARLAVQAA